MVVKAIDIFLSRPRKVLMLFGIWFPPKKYIYLHYLKKIIIMLMQFSFILFEFIYVIVVWGDLDEVSDASYLLFTQASVCYKTSVFILNMSNLRHMLDFMQLDVFAPQTPYHDNVLMKNARKVKNLCAVFLFTAIMTVSLWAIVPLLDDAETRYFPFKIWMPVAAEKSPHYQLGYVYQITSIYSSAMLFFAIDSTILSMVMFGCAQIEIVIDKIRKIQKIALPAKCKQNHNKKVKENNMLLIECIYQHQTVIRFIELVEDTYHANIFFQLSGTVLIICITGLRITMTESTSVQFYSMLVYMITMLSQLFLFCWCGSELTIKSEDLRDWLYQCPWHEQDQIFKRSLLIAMERMKRPIIIKAGHYIPLSRPTFVSILRSSYSFFAVLNQTNNK